MNSTLENNSTKNQVERYFDLSGRVAVITGGLGLLGPQHAEAIVAAGGIPVLVDIRDTPAKPLPPSVAATACILQADITNHQEVQRVLDEIITRYGRVDILINNAANNPKMENTSDVQFSRFENFSFQQWQDDLTVGLTGAFFCSQIIGSEMARRGKGVIVNVGSDFAVIAPDQRIYRVEGLPEDRQPVKPVSYSVVKMGLIGLTKYLATYWADAGVRVNAISPGGVYNGQPDDFVQRLTKLVPLGRMANPQEYQAAILFLCSDASSYVTGSNLIVDGGRSSW